MTHQHQYHHQQQQQQQQEEEELNCTSRASRQQNDDLLCNQNEENVRCHQTIQPQIAQIQNQLPSININKNAPPLPLNLNARQNQRRRMRKRIPKKCNFSRHFILLIIIITALFTIYSAAEEAAEEAPPTTAEEIKFDSALPQQQQQSNPNSKRSASTTTASSLDEILTSLTHRIEADLNKVEADAKNWVQHEKEREEQQQLLLKQEQQQEEGKKVKIKRRHNNKNDATTEKDIHNKNPKTKEKNTNTKKNNQNNNNNNKKQEKNKISLLRRPLDNNNNNTTLPLLDQTHLLQDVNSLQSDVKSLITAMSLSQSQLLKARAALEEKEVDVARKREVLEETQRMYDAVKEGKVKVKVDYESGEVLIEENDEEVVEENTKEENTDEEEEEEEEENNGGLLSLEHIQEEDLQQLNEILKLTEQQQHQDGEEINNNGEIDIGSAVLLTNDGLDTFVDLNLNKEQEEHENLKVTNSGMDDVVGDDAESSKVVSDYEKIVMEDAEKDVLSSATPKDGERTTLSINNEKSQTHNNERVSTSTTSKTTTTTTENNSLKTLLQTKLLSPLASTSSPPTDPAVLQIDIQLLLDIVTLAITAALFGLLAVFLNLPPTAGMLIGGMLIGPSCWDLMEYKVQVRTLASFGSIFLLFEQGLVYSQTYAGNAAGSSSGVHHGSNKNEGNKGGNHSSSSSSSSTPISTTAVSTPRGYDVRHIVRRIEENVDTNSPSMRRKGNSTTTRRSFAFSSPSSSLGISGTLSNNNNSNPHPYHNHTPQQQQQQQQQQQHEKNDNEHDPTIVGAIILVLLLFITFAIYLFSSSSSTTSSATEGLIVASSIALCSTTVVSENLHAAGLGGTNWGSGVLKIVAMQDLFMVPVLALPEMIGYFYEIVKESSSDHSHRSYEEDGGGEENVNGEERGEDDDDDIATHEEKILRRFTIGILLHLLLVALFAKGSIFLAKHILHAAAMADTRLQSSKGELFTLSIVAYALLMATICEELQLSIEAGALFAGIVLMKSQHVPKVLESIQSITSVFGGMFLTSMGTIISPSFVLNHIWIITLLVVSIGLFKMMLVSIVLNRFFDYGITPSLAVGSAMAQISEISLVVLAKSQRLGLVSRKTYLMLIPTTCILLSLAPFSASHLRRLKMQEITGNDDDGHVPFYLCFLRCISILRHPRQKTSIIPLHSSRSEDAGDDVDDSRSHRHR